MGRDESEKREESKGGQPLAGHRANAHNQGHRESPGGRKDQGNRTRASGARSSPRAAIPPPPQSSPLPEPDDRALPYGHLPTPPRTCIRPPGCPRATRLRRTLRLGRVRRCPEQPPLGTPSARSPGASGAQAQLQQLLRRLWVFAVPFPGRPPCNVPAVRSSSPLAARPLTP